MNDSDQDYVTCGLLEKYDKASSFSSLAPVSSRRWLSSFNNFIVATGQLPGMMLVL